MHMTAYSDIPHLYGIDSIHLLVMFSLNIVINVVLQDYTYQGKPQPNDQAW